MQTVSVNVSALCVPCHSRCRYCLLSWDGRLVGADYERSRSYAERFNKWIKLNRPELSFVFYFGYSMEHPDLTGAIGFLRSIGSPAGRMLQLNGIGFRRGIELDEYIQTLTEHGIEQVDLTFYGMREYHDRFAGRQGDFDFMLDILKASNRLGLPVEISVPLTSENVSQADELLRLFEGFDTERIFFFVPHSEGRGRSLNNIRLTESDTSALSERVLSHFNRTRYKTEREWLDLGGFSVPTRRMLNFSLTPENIAQFESMDFAEAIAWLEGLDDAYYAAIPPINQLAQLYGNANGQSYYSLHDLTMTYQLRYITEHHLDVYDIHDERQCFVRRF